MRFRLLGALAVTDGDDVLPVPGALVRALLAALLLDAGTVVGAQRLIAVLWHDKAPPAALSSLRNLVQRLRKSLRDTSGRRVRTVGTGYLIDVAPDELDLALFTELYRRGRDTRRAGDWQGCAQALREGLSLVDGEPLSDLPQSPFFVDAADRLNAQRLNAISWRIDAELHLGWHEDVVTELESLTVRHPLREPFHGQLMLALHRCGRQAEALAAYQRVRAALVAELGTEPAQDLRDLHQRILTDDPDLVPASTATAAPVVPAQLPGGIDDFVGRSSEIRTLWELLGGPATVAIVGAGGIGKTWLALHWAHQHIDEFPDGQLFVNLRGFDPTGVPVTPAAAIRGFLTALGVAADAIPVDLDAQAGLYRSLVAGKRMLILLDNAATTDQVAPLLPGTAACTVLVTSRRTLTALITHHSAHHVPLGILTEHEAHALLVRRLGAARVAAEPGAAARLIQLCGRYPLALTIMAGRAHARPHLPLIEFTTELQESGVHALSDSDPGASLPTVLSWSLHGLSDQQRRAFALLSIAPGPDIGLPAAAGLTALPLPEVRRVLQALEEASLSDRHAHDRYAMHDLIRAYAATTHQDLAEDVRAAALCRVIDFYLHTAYTANRLLNPHRPPIRLGPAGHPPLPIPDQPAALAWFDAEHTCLLAVQHVAAAHGCHQIAWSVAWTLSTYHYRRDHRHDDLAVWTAGLAAARHLRDPTTRALAHRYLGRALGALGDHDEAIGHLYEALALVERHHNPTGEAEAHRALALAWESRGDDRQALHHATCALHLFHDLDRPLWEANALSAMGRYAARLGEYDHARAHCRAALRLHRSHHDPDIGAAILDGLGYIDHHTGHHDRAITRYRHALALRRDLGHTYEVANSLDALGHPYAALGCHEQARTAWREALELYRRQGRDTDAGRVQGQLSRVTA